MNYFITGYISDNLSGVELAQIKRLRVFEAHKEPAKLVSIDWSSKNQFLVHKHHLNNNNSINLFSYFQRNSEYHGKKMTINGLKIPRESTQKKDENGYSYYARGGTKRLSVKFRSSNYVEQATYYDQYGNPMHIDIYDEAGFLNQRQMIGFDGRVSHRLYYDVDGNVVIRTAFTLNDGRLGENSYSLYENGKLVQMFSYFQDFITYFLNCLANEHKEMPTFILDSPFRFERAFFNLDDEVRRFVYVHNALVQEPENPMESKPATVVDQYLANQDKIDGLIFSTERQQSDFVKRFSPKFNTYVIPVGVVNEADLKPISMTKRPANKILSVARIHSQKRLEDTIDAVRMIRKKLPDVTLDIWGYSNDDELFAKLKQQVEDNGLQKNVHFKGYNDKVEKLYDKYDLLMVTSRFEGFGLSTLEAQSHGLPVVSYNINYGPDEIIKDHVTGILVPSGDVTEMATAVYQLLSNQAELQKYSDAAYQNSVQKFGSKVIWKKWETLLSQTK